MGFRGIGRELLSNFSMQAVFTLIWTGNAVSWPAAGVPFVGVFAHREIFNANRTAVGVHFRLNFISRQDAVCNGNILHSAVKVRRGWVKRFANIQIFCSCKAGRGCSCCNLFTVKENPLRFRIGVVLEREIIPLISFKGLTGAQVVVVNSQVRL